MKAANYCVFQSYGVILLTYLMGPMTSLAWGPVGGRPLNPPLCIWNIISKFDLCELVMCSTEPFVRRK